MRCTLYITGYGNRIQNGSQNCFGVYQSSGFEGENYQSSQSQPDNQSEGRSDTKGGE
jgi:hypothetical protein